MDIARQHITKTKLTVLLALESGKAQQNGKNEVKSWTMKKWNRKNNDAFELWYWRKRQKIS